MKMTLKGARVNAGYTQKEIANLIGVNETTIVNWESGNTAITAKHLLSLCNLYKMAMDDILLPQKLDLN